MRRLCKNEDGSSEVEGEINLMTRSEVEEFMDARNDVNKWSAHVREYLKDVNQDLLASKKHMFIIDSEIFLTNTQPVRRISVMVWFLANSLRIYTGCRLQRVRLQRAHGYNEQIILCQPDTISLDSFCTDWNELGGPDIVIG